MSTEELLQEQFITQNEELEILCVCFFLFFSFFVTAVLFGRNKMQYKAENRDLWVQDKREEEYRRRKVCFSQIHFSHLQTDEYNARMHHNFSTHIEEILFEIIR